MAYVITAKNFGASWNGAQSFRAKTLETGIRTAARKLGVRIDHGLTRERVGADQWRIVGNVDTFMLIAVEVP